MEDTGAPVEPLPGFPKTESEAKAACGAVGCPEDFAAVTWNKAISRGGRDAKDIPIRSWGSHLAVEWAYQRERLAKAQSPTPTPESAPQGQTPPRTAPLWQQAKALETLIHGVKTELDKLQPPSGPLHDAERKRILALRTPLVQRKAELIEQLTAINERMAKGEA